MHTHIVTRILKIDPSQNHDLSTSIERPYKELLNALIGFEIRHSKLKLRAVQRKGLKMTKIPLEHGL